MKSLETMRTPSLKLQRIVRKSGPGFPRLTMRSSKRGASDGSQKWKATFGSGALASPSDRYPPQWHRRFPALCSRLNLECVSKFPQADGLAHPRDVALIAWKSI